MLLLVVSTDVRHYRKLIGWMAWLTAALGLALLAVDLHAGMPASWTWSEGPPAFLIAFGDAVPAPLGSAERTLEKRRNWPIRIRASMFWSGG